MKYSDRLSSISDSTKYSNDNSTLSVEELLTHLISTSNRIADTQLKLEKMMLELKGYKEKKTERIESNGSLYLDPDDQKLSSVSRIAAKIKNPPQKSQDDLDRVCEMINSLLESGKTALSNTPQIVDDSSLDDSTANVSDACVGDTQNVLNIYSYVPHSKDREKPHISAEVTKCENFDIISPFFAKVEKVFPDYPQVFKDDISFKTLRRKKARMFTQEEWRNILPMTKESKLEYLTSISKTRKINLKMKDVQEDLVEDVANQIKGAVEEIKEVMEAALERQGILEFMNVVFTLNFWLLTHTVAHFWYKK